MAEMNIKKNQPELPENVSDFASIIDSDEANVIRISDFNRRILDSAPISIITIDKNGIITFANKYFKNFSSTHIFE